MYQKLAIVSHVLGIKIGRTIQLAFLILFIAGCGSSNAPTTSRSTSEFSNAKSTTQIQNLTTKLLETEEKPRVVAQIAPEPIRPTAFHIEDIGRYWAEGLSESESSQNSVLSQYDVPVNESNFSAIKDALTVFDKQFEYAEKLLFKDYLLEFYGLKDEVLNLNYSDRYPAENRKLIAKFFEETEECYLQAGIAMNAFVIRRDLEISLKEMYLTGEPISLVGVNVVYNLLTHLRDSIRFFEQRHERVHEFIAASRNFQLNDGRKVVPFLVEEHAYWSVDNYSVEPDINKYLYKPVKRKFDSNKFNYGPKFLPHPKAIETTCITGDGSDFIYLRMKFPEETSGMLLKGEAPREPAMYGNDAYRKEVDWSKSTALSYTEINREILRWARRRGIEGPYAGNYSFEFEAVASRWVRSHLRTLQFLQREGGTMIGEKKLEGLDVVTESLVRSGAGGAKDSPEKNNVLPFSKELVMYELLLQAPNAKNSDYLPEFDDAIEVLKNWIANKGE